MLSAFLSLQLFSSNNINTDVEEKWFEDQLVDHFNVSSGKWSQRYFLNSQYVQSMQNISSVIIFIGHEQTLDSSSVTKPFFTTLANQTNSLIIGLEHRFFGKSYPTANLSNENLKYLTVEQAMEDLASFITSKVLYNPNNSSYCTFDNCTITITGRSYGGTLAAWFRMKYPHLSNSSWASSAPLHVIDDFYLYDVKVADMYYNYSENCYNDLKAALDQLDPHYKDLFNFSGTDISFLFSIADVYSHIIQYKTRYPGLIDQVCEKIQPRNTEAVLESVNLILSEIGSDLNSFDPMSDNLKNINISENPYANSRAWSYMTCSQFGWFQTAVPDIYTPQYRSLRSNKINLDYFNTVCLTLFSIDRPNNTETTGLNERYGGKGVYASRTVFVNGIGDPWSTLSINVTDISIDKVLYSILNGSHCSEYDPPSPNDNAEINLTRKTLVNHMTKWIYDMPCKNGGQKILGECICPTLYSGKLCEIEVHARSSFHTISIVSLTIPTILVLCVGFYILFVNRVSDSEIGSRPSLYT